MITLCRLDDNDDLIFSVNNDEEKASNEDIKYITKIIDCIIQLTMKANKNSLYVILNHFQEYSVFFVRTVPDNDVINFNFIITFSHTLLVVEIFVVEVRNKVTHTLYLPVNHFISSFRQ